MGFFLTDAWQLAAVAILMSLYLLMDAWMVIRMKRAAKNDPIISKKHSGVVDG